MQLFVGAESLSNIFKTNKNMKKTGKTKQKVQTASEAPGAFSSLQQRTSYHITVLGLQLKDHHNFKGRVPFKTHWLYHRN